MRNENRKKYARRIYEQTGIRYADSGYCGKKQKRKRREIFDPLRANKSLERTFEGPWVKYRCPNCDFYCCARAYQGWPEHTCKGGWK